MRLLFIGDIVGRPGRDIVCQAVPQLVARHKLDLVIANAENAAGGSGLTPDIYRDLIAAGVDGITLGDHCYRRREIFPVLNKETNIVRPANLPEEAHGSMWTTLTARDGSRVALFTMLGQLYMKPADSPFRVADRLLASIGAEVAIRFLDFHAEATGEAQMMGRYLDGRVSAVLGTHTHVPTADECILPGGTAFQCDVGMTGPFESILGRRIDRVLETRLTANPTQFDVATEDVRLCGTIVEVDSATGRATGIERVMVRESELA
ncbi:MAG TPA: TIGR00282 family metallophosphoesterase [Lacipirellulaceae bacterium]|nr:TIGR00282 family metallophosphoesterase [Lacipirellulaceae bacterium]